MRKRVQSVVQAKGKPGDRQALSCVALVLLLCFPLLPGGFLARLRRFHRAREWV